MMDYAVQIKVAKGYVNINPAHAPFGHAYSDSKVCVAEGE